MNQIEIAILQLLQAQAIGAANAMNVDQIFAALNAANLPVVQGRTQEHIRGAVRSLVNNHNELIGSRSGFQGGGYYVIANRDEVIDTILDLVNRSHKMLGRVEQLKATWNNNNPNQQL